jgi:TonB family protein
MSDLVSSAIDARLREPDSLRTMLMVSTALHAVAIAAIVVVPGLVGVRTRAPETVMTISLGGVAGPISGGMTPISSRPVQQVVPSELPRPQSVRPPAQKPPEMVEPSKARPTPSRPVNQAPKQASGRTPTTGAEEKKGQGRVETGSQHNEAGLSTGGGGDNSQVSLGNFCDPQYIGQMIALIHRNWNNRQPSAGAPVVRYVIQRDGTLTDISLKQASGFQMLDFMAQRAVIQTKALPPLPSCYPYDTFIVNLTFEYIR